MAMKLIACFLLMVAPTNLCASRKFVANTVSTTTTVLFSSGVTTFTVAFWLRNDVTVPPAADVEIFAYSPLNSRDFAITWKHTGTACTQILYQFKTTSGYYGRGFAYPVATGWHHYTFVFSTSDTGWAAYVDGVAQTLDTCDATPTAGLTLYDVSGRQFFWDRTTNGHFTIYGVGVWEIALTENHALSLASCVNSEGVMKDKEKYIYPLFGHNEGAGNNEPEYGGTQLNSAGWNAIAADDNAPVCPATGIYP